MHVCAPTIVKLNPYADLKHLKFHLPSIAPRSASLYVHRKYIARRIPASVDRPHILTIADIPDSDIESTPTTLTHPNNAAERSHLVSGHIPICPLPYSIPRCAYTSPASVNLYTDQRRYPVRYGRCTRTRRHHSGLPRRSTSQSMPCTGGRSFLLASETFSPSSLLSLRCQTESLTTTWYSALHRRCKSQKPGASTDSKS